MCPFPDSFEEVTYGITASYTRGVDFLIPKLTG
jgi:hypothetical protein